MSDVRGHAALEAYARQHGLTFEGEGLLPAATPLLRRGLGAGEHRAGVNEGRSIDRLDALRAAAVRAAGGVPALTE